MKTDELSDHLFQSVLGAFDTLSVHIGAELGLYPALHHDAGRTAAELAELTGMHPRYAREWLEQQCVAGIVHVDDPDLDSAERRYRIDDEHAAVLSDPESLSYFTPFARVVSAAASQLPALMEAYRTGGGVSWSTYGPSMREGQADANRPLYLSVLGSQWLPAVPGVHAALSAGGRVADIGCGDGWSSVGIGLAYPEATVDGFDVDADSVRAAAGHAEEYGLAERVRFHEVDAATASNEGSYDLVTALECVHDLPDPVSVLRAARRLVREGGSVVVMDERVPERFTGPGDLVEQLMYGMSLLICLPDGMSGHRADGGPSVATGTVMRPETLRGYAREAGFADVEVLPIEHDLFRFYRLVS